jgi:flagellar motor switch protein FliG
MNSATTIPAPTSNDVTFGGGLAANAELKPAFTQAPLVLDGPARAAAVLLTMGPDQAGVLLESFSPEEIQAVSSRLQSVRTLSREQLCQVLEDFRQITQDKKQVSFDTDSFMKSMLDKFSADLQPGAAASSRRVPALEALVAMGPEVLFDKLRQEHPQVAATLLSMLPGEIASQVIEEFEPEYRTELLLRVALLDRVEPSALTELNQVLENALRTESFVGASSGLGGAKAVAGILDNITADTTKQVLSHLREHDAALADQIQASMFSFEDFAKLDPRAIQRLIPEVPGQALAIALRAASDSLREFLMQQMTVRMAERIRFEISSLPPARIKEVEDAQREMVSTARRLADQNLISLERTKN